VHMCVLMCGSAHWICIGAYSIYVSHINMQYTMNTVPKCAVTRSLVRASANIRTCWCVMVRSCVHYEYRVAKTHRMPQVAGLLPQKSRSS